MEMRTFYLTIKSPYLRRNFECRNVSYLHKHTPSETQCEDNKIVAKSDRNASCIGTHRSWGSEQWLLLGIRITTAKI